MMSLQEVYGCLEQEGKVQDDGREKKKHTTYKQLLSRRCSRNGKC